MRIQVVFLILAGLLTLCLIGDLCQSASQYIEISALLSLKETPGHESEEQGGSAAMRERRNGFFEVGIERGVEILLLGGLCACFFRVLKQKRVAEEAVE